MNQDKDPDHTYRRQAKILRKAIVALDPVALTRARNIFHDLFNVIDSQVHEIMPLGRCQHVVAKESGFNNWHDLIHRGDSV